jgi:iron complex transport system permease protein
MSGVSEAVVNGPAAAPRLRALLAGPLLFPVLFLFLGAVTIAAMAVGGAGIPLTRIPAALGLAHPVDIAVAERDGLVLLSVRLPRIAIAIVIGALLAASGAIMQGLFRNPLADPALVGVSSGGALAVAGTIVIGDRMTAQGTSLPFAVLPIAAFCGSLVTTAILQRLATRGRTTSIAIFLLAGLAIAALANAGIGLLVFVADDRQLRDITFWLLGSLGGATWEKVSLIVPFLLVLLVTIPFIGRGLDLLVLGEAEAFHMGIAVERLKRVAIVMIAAMTGAAVAFAGVVGFVGIVVPHLLRIVIGPGHRKLLPASAILGATLMLAADTAARTIVAPAEVPIGVLTALVGAPFFLMLLLRQRGLAGL